MSFLREADALAAVIEGSIVEPIASSVPRLPIHSPRSV
jgi:hypothetical protein